MIRFRNPGTQYSTQVQVFKELYKEYHDSESFDLNDMAATIANCNMMTAYGYGGENALALSENENESLNSALMNAKMYAEVFRLLGWVSSFGKRSYPLVFTYIGDHVASLDNVLPLYEQCVIGINNPQEIMNVKYTEKNRFFKTALRSLVDLDRKMYKHELCIGPMCIDDQDENQYIEMIRRIKTCRSSMDRLEAEYSSLCERLKVKKTLPDNSTRLPIAFMKTCRWVLSTKSSTLYPPKSLECISITEKGISVWNALKGMKDLRLDEYNSYSTLEKEALIRLGVYSMLKRAGYSLESVQGIYDEDLKTCETILQGKELLFSPYQTLKRETVEKALGIIRNGTRSARHTSMNAIKIEKDVATVSALPLRVKIDQLDSTDKEVCDLQSLVIKYKNAGMNSSEISERIFEDFRNSTQTEFYPFIATLFRTMGFDCRASRPGDNGARWDAIIIHKEKSIPIEIKSPTEELRLSMKAIRQALENKIILLARKTHVTTKETTSLAVGYYPPNDRADVSQLMKDFKTVFSLRTGVMDLKSLITIAVSIINDGISIDPNTIFELEGYADVIEKSQ